MKTIPSLIATLVFLLTRTCPAGTQDDAEAFRSGWPGNAGPYGTFVAAPIDTPLVDDLTKARMIWESECADLGNAKGGSQAYRTIAQFTAEAVAKKVAPGSWSGAIVGDGLVFVHSWRPTGSWFEVEGQKVRLDAEDFVVAMDPQTGRTRWQTFVPGGILRGGGKREGFQVGPVYHKGLVIALTSTAKLVAFDAKTGKIKWESDAHPERALAMKAREGALAGLGSGKFKYDLNPDRCASMAVVGDVLIVPFGLDGLVGVDLESGVQKWRRTKVTTRWATPAGWSDQLLAANATGELRLIEPATGKELWLLSGLGPNWSTLVPGRTHLLVNTVADSGKAKGRERVLGRYGAVKLSLTGAEKAWEAPAAHCIPVWMDSGARNRVLYQNGRFLIPHAAHEVGGGKEVAPAYLLEESTGRVLCELPATGDRDDWLAGLIYWCGDRLISRADSFHGPTHGGRHPWQHWSTVGDRITLLPGKMDLGEFATAYEVAMEVPMVAGRMFERSITGRLLCYDLRQPANNVTRELKRH